MDERGRFFFLLPFPGFTSIFPVFTSIFPFFFSISFHFSILPSFSHFLPAWRRATKVYFGRVRDETRKNVVPYCDYIFEVKFFKFPLPPSSSPLLDESPVLALVRKRGSGNYHAYSRRGLIQLIDTILSGNCYSRILNSFCSVNKQGQPVYRREVIDPYM